MKNKKLIIICPSMWPDMNLWGETQRMYYLANYLAEWGWQITVISPSYDVDKKNLEIRQKKYKNLYLGSPIKKAGGGGAGLIQGMPCFSFCIWGSWQAGLSV